MAADQVLLDAVDQDPSTAVIRTYEWSEPTLSLGYFQSYSELQSDSRWQGVHVVRRPSGGGALWHHHELTYSVVVPRSLPDAQKPANLYRLIHESLADGLRAKQFAASRRHLQHDSGQDSPSRAGDRPFLCFLDQDPEDVVIGNSKVIGSAQRRRPAAVLQHGAILRARSERTPELPGLTDLGTVAGSLESWIHDVPLTLARALGLELSEETWTDELQAAIHKAMDTQFTCKEWTQKR